MAMHKLCSTVKSAPSYFALIFNLACHFQPLPFPFPKTVLPVLKLHRVVIETLLLTPNGAFRKLPYKDLHSPTPEQLPADECFITCSSRTSEAPRVRFVLSL
jgi:hypothetical protein